MPPPLLTITRCIIHRIPRRSVHGQPAGREPELSDVESDLGPRVAGFLAEKIADNLADANVVHFDPTTTSPVPGLVRAFFGADDSSIVAMSRTMASHLHSCQRAVSPAGLLLVLEVSVDHRRELVILKVEEENGVQIAAREELADQRGFRMILQEDLFLTQTTRVYKVGAFMASGGDVEGRVLDRQRGAGRIMASFFLKDFLGCEFGTRADLSTQAFMDNAEAFINTQVSEPGTQARYETALLAELQSHAGEIRVRQFANQHLDVEHRQSFEDVLRAERVPMVVPKDVTLVRNRIDRVQWVFESGVSVLAPRDRVDVVDVTRVGDLTRLIIEDRLRRTVGHGRR